MRHSMIGVSACALVLACAAGPAQAAGLYKCKTLGGRMIVSDRPCTQASLGKENLKLATPPPQASQPPERSPHDTTFEKGGAADRKAATAAAVEPPAPAREQPSGIKREEEAERQSGIDSK